MTMVSLREIPWMTLGKIIDEPMNAAEAAAATGLNFEVIKATLSWDSDEIGMAGVIDDRRAIIRKDNGACLGIMANTYNVLQYGEAFDFMDVVNPTYVAAGCLKRGKQGFMVVKTPETINVLGGDDPHDLYLILRTSHDGSRAVEVTVQPLRNRCMNQLTLPSFSRGVPYRWSVKHTTTMRTKLTDAHLALERMGAYAREFEATAEKFANFDISDDVAINVLKSVLPDKPRRDDQIQTIVNNWHTSSFVGFAGTSWGMLNAVSEYYEWGRTGGSAESRFIGALQGPSIKVTGAVAQRLYDLVA